MNAENHEEVEPALQSILTGQIGVPVDSFGSTAIERRTVLHAAWRLGAHTSERESPSDVEIVTIEAPAPHGPIPIRMFKPISAVKPGCHVFFHGGGYWLGSSQLSERHSAWLAHLSGVTVASVDYRLAPEHPYPAPVDDCRLASDWLTDNADALGFSPHDISVGGESAGGNAAALVALARSRSEARPNFLALALSVPLLDWTDGDMTDPSIDPRYMPQADGNALMTEYFFGESPSPADLVAASPLLAPDLSALPQTLVMTAQFDRLRNPALAFARKATIAGVEVSSYHASGLFHGATGLTALSSAAREYEATYAEFIASAHSIR